MKTWSAMEVIERAFDPMMPNYEYIEQVFQYIQQGRLDLEQLENVIPYFLKFTKVPGQIPNSENMFIGLCATFEVRPIHYLAYLTGRTIEDVEYTKQNAVNFISREV